MTRPEDFDPSNGFVISVEYIQRQLDLCGSESHPLMRYEHGSIFAQLNALNAIAGHYPARTDQSPFLHEEYDIRNNALDRASGPDGSEQNP